MRNFLTLALIMVCACGGGETEWTSRGGNACEWKGPDGVIHKTPDNPDCEESESDGGTDANPEVR